MKVDDGRVRRVDLYTGSWDGQTSVWGCRLKALDPAHPYVHLQGRLNQVTADRRSALQDALYVLKVTLQSAVIRMP